MTVQIDAVHVPPATFSGHALSDIRTGRSADLDEAVDLVLRQVERVRVNLGGSGPPGRAD